MLNLFSFRLMLEDLGLNYKRDSIPQITLTTIFGDYKIARHRRVYVTKEHFHFSHGMCQLLYIFIYKAIGWSNLTLSRGWRDSVSTCS